MDKKLPALVCYQPKDVTSKTRIRKGEQKIGETICTIPSLSLEALIACPAKYVILGLPEDIGVRANLGRGGAYSAWQPAFQSILNLQHNFFLAGHSILLLGHIDFDSLMIKVKDYDFNNENDLAAARKIVDLIDDAVAQVCKLLFEAGKVPIIIGGGHNNCYPIIKSLSEIKLNKVNVINCDAHADYRPLEGRHSGNGFSYASAEGYLDKYAMVGLHENYNTFRVMKELMAHKEKFHFTTFEQIFIREQISFDDAIQAAASFIGQGLNGLEIDVDTIQNIPSSAKTSSGISTIQARQFVAKSTTILKPHYLHIAEAAPVLSHLKTDNKTGKLIAYLVSDFIKAHAFIS
ncbi:MAG: hypothetical protein RIQ89_1391 [Bacteroidota bacterium]|jgi:formiminoglutamase